MEGVFTSTTKGFGFVTAEGLPQDLYVPAEFTGGAFYGDKVLVKLLPTFSGNIIPAGRDGRRQEAEVVRILERGIKRLTGTFSRVNHQALVTPDNHKISRQILIRPEDTMRAVNGHKVVVEMTDYGFGKRPPEGKIVEILGHMDDPGVDILSIIRAYNLPGEFPEEAMEEARRLPQELTGVLPSRNEDDPAPGRREDLRGQIVVTIDGPDTKDIDDAISVEKDGDNYILGVHIADVSEYVRENSALDQEALRRATSIYLVDRVIPMLPHELSNGICSLNPGEDRLALSCIMTIDHEGKLLDSRITESLIRSRAKLSYPGVMKLLEDGDTAEITQQLGQQGICRGMITRTREIVRMLRRAKRLASVLHKQRRVRGSIDFDFAESEVHLDEKGRPVDIAAHERNAATEMIEDFMLMANETVASTFYWLDVPFVYRTHEKPPEEKLRQLRMFIRGYGYSLKGSASDIHPREISRLLSKLSGTKEEAMISRMTLRSMSRAEYTTTCSGHFGLALSYYCHFTSPIRRYPDLQIHRIIKEYLHGKLSDKRRSHYAQLLPDVCRQSSLRERLADEAERESIKQKIAEYMKEHLGEEFEGVISSVTGWGLYVELPNTVEGLVPVSSLRDDYYIFNPEQYILTGEHTHRTFELGQKVSVIASGADIIMRTVDFRLAGKDGSRDKVPRKDGRKSEHGRRKHKAGRK